MKIKTVPSVRNYFGSHSSRLKDVMISSQIIKFRSEYYTTISNMYKMHNLIVGTEIFERHFSLSSSELIFQCFPNIIVVHFLTLHN